MHTKRFLQITIVTSYAISLGAVLSMAERQPPEISSEHHEVSLRPDSLGLCDDLAVAKGEISIVGVDKAKVEREVRRALRTKEEELKTQENDLDCENNFCEDGTKCRERYYICVECAEKELFDQFEGEKRKLWECTGLLYHGCICDNVI